MTCRAEKRSVIRRSAFAPPRRLRRPRRRMADDGLRPFPPYASETQTAPRGKPRSAVSAVGPVSPRCRR
nr:hypothetical protein [Thioalkalivibrio paradoxus]